MKSLQEYIEIYRGIARKLNIQGDSVEILAQLLANATYIGEVENINYALESSLERATLINSKIQLCMNEMYSVFRGSCPRVILRFKPQKYFSLNPFDEIISSNRFKVYYLGYYDKNFDAGGEKKSDLISPDSGFRYSSITIPPSGETDYIIMGLLAKETVSKEWVLNENNTYYVDCTEDDLSNDFWIKVGGQSVEHTRNFADHIIDGKVFDLTIPNYGSRLYVVDILGSSDGGRIKDFITETPANTKVEAFYYKFSNLSEYNSSDLRKLSLKGAELVDLDQEWLSKRGQSQYERGLCYLSESPKDTSFTIHYKANRDRFVNNLLRSNSDIGTVLEEFYPSKIVSGGTSYKFEEDTLNIYYVPISRTNPLTDQEILEYINNKTSYYITESINIGMGNLYIAVFNINLELYQNTNVDNEIASILGNYENKFNINLNDRIEEIRSSISKIPNVKQIIELSIMYSQEDGTPIEAEEVERIDINNSYFNINYIINSIIRR